jgi:ABC-2 type transport system ATP-binding protein
MRKVSQRRMIEVQLSSAEQVRRAAELIRSAVDEASDVVASDAEAVVRFRTERTESEMGDVLARLVGDGLKVTQFREVQSDLEDAFLHVTRNDEEPQEAPADKSPAAEPDHQSSAGEAQ